MLTATGYLPIEALLGTLTNFQDGRAKLKFMQVATTNNNYFTMPEKVLTNEELFRSLIGVDDDGDFAFRVGVHTVTGSTKLTKAELTETQLLHNCIGVSTDGKPYLRIVLQTI